jgi:hypothetical protein
MKVCYYNECKWVDTGDGLIFQFVDGDGEPLAEVALRDADAKLWKFEVILPERFQWNGSNAAGLVLSQSAAKKVCELILVNSIVSK